MFRPIDGPLCAALRRRIRRVGLCLIATVATVVLAVINLAPTFGESAFASLPEPALAALGGAVGGPSGRVARADSSAALPPSLTLTSVLDGTSHAVAYAAPHLFLAVGPRVIVLDATDLGAPVEIGKTDMFPGTVIELALGADKVFAGIDLGDGTAYLLCVIGVADPLAPAVHGCTALAGYPERIVADGDVAYVAVNPGGMDVIDVSNPRLPARITTYVTGSAASDIDIAGGRAYIAVEEVVYVIGGVPNTLGGVVMVDISNPAAPFDAGVFNRDIPDGLQIVERLRVRGTRGYAIGNDRVSVYDLTDPDDPFLLGQTLATRAANSRLVLGDDELWLVHPLPEVGATRVDISDPSMPRVTNALDTPHDSMEWSGVAVGDGLVAATRLGGYDFLDLSDTSAPVITTPYTALGSVSAVVILGDHLIAAARQHGLAVVDISDPAETSVLAVVGEENRDAIAVAAHAGNAYVLSPSTPTLAPRLDVYDLSALAAPALIRTLEPAANAVALAVFGGRLYVVGDDFEVYDLTDPSSPARVDGIPLAHSASEIALAGSHAYLGGPSPWIVPVDISDPARPVELAPVSMQGGIAGVAMGAGGLHVALRERGLSILDLSNPAAPVRNVDVPDFGRLRALALGGGRPWLLKARQLITPDPEALLEKAGTATLILPIEVSDIAVTDEVNSLIVAAGEGIAFVRSMPGVEPTPTITPALTPTASPTPDDGPPTTPLPGDPTHTPTPTPDGSPTGETTPTDVPISHTPTPVDLTPGTPTTTSTPEATSEDVLERIHLPWVHR